MKSWTRAELYAFRDAVHDHRLCGCWLLSTYGLTDGYVVDNKFDVGQTTG